MKKSYPNSIPILVIVSLLLCGCMQAPKENAVISKNDGSFDINVVQTAPDATETTEYKEICYTDTFMNSDNSVEFELAIDETFANTNMPVVEIVPHYLTESDAKRVAEVLFENASFYEARPLLSETYSKDELLEKIKRWSEYTSPDAVQELLGRDGTSTAELVQLFIEDYTLMSETASEDPIVGQCQWQFKKSSFYTVSAEEASQRDISNDNDQISAEVKVGDISYKYNVSKRNLPDYKLNNISAYLDAGTSPDSIDSAIFRSWLCRTEQPTQDQIYNVQLKAEQMLAELGLGQWQVDQCFVETKYFGDDAEYTIVVTAVPVLNGVSAIRQPQISNLNLEEAYASNYYLTDVRFEFSADGRLVEFWLESPIEVKEVINENVAVMSFDDLVQQLRNLLALRDSEEFDLPAMEDAAGEKIKCTVRIDHMEYGLSRVKVPDTDESYYYVPSVLFSGSKLYYGEESGTVYFESAESEPLVALNAVDGTNIALWQG